MSTVLEACSKCDSSHPFEELSKDQQLCNVGVLKLVIVLPFSFRCLNIDICICRNVMVVPALLSVPVVEVYFT